MFIRRRFPAFPNQTAEALVNTAYGDMRQATIQADFYHGGDIKKDKPPHVHFGVQDALLNGTTTELGHNDMLWAPKNHTKVDKSIEDHARVRSKPLL